MKLTLRETSIGAFEPVPDHGRGGDRALSGSGDVTRGEDIRKKKLLVERKG